MTDKQLKEWANTLGISVEEAKKLRQRGIEARKRDNRFVASKGSFNIKPPNDK